MVGQFRLTFQITVKLKRVDLKVQNFVCKSSRIFQNCKVCWNSIRF